MAGVLSIVVPCFNEEAVLNQCLNELDEILKSRQKVIFYLLMMVAQTKHGN